jgi:hypothetical protein
MSDVEGFVVHGVLGCDKNCSLVEEVEEDGEEGRTICGCCGEDDNGRNC